MVYYVEVVHKHIECDKIVPYTKVYFTYKFLDRKKEVFDKCIFFNSVVAALLLGLLGRK